MIGALAQYVKLFDLENADDVSLRIIKDKKDVQL
jgi:hypothetical protein